MCRIPNFSYGSELYTVYVWKETSIVCNNMDHLTYIRDLLLLLVYSHTCTYLYENMNVHANVCAGNMSSYIKVCAFMLLLFNNSYCGQGV